MVVRIAFLHAGMHDPTLLKAIGVLKPRLQHGRNAVGALCKSIGAPGSHDPNGLGVPMGLKKWSTIPTHFRKKPQGNPPSISLSLSLTLELTLSLKRRPFLSLSHAIAGRNATSGRRATSGHLVAPDLAAIHVYLRLFGGLH